MKINKSEKPLLLGIVLSFLVLIILFPSTKKVPSPWQLVSLPDISVQPLRLRVVHAVNSRFNSLTDEQFSRVLEHTRFMVKQHFNLHVIFEKSENISVDKVFTYLPEQVQSERKQQIINLNKISDASFNSMWHSIYSSLTQYKNNPDSVINYAKPYLINNKDVTDLATLTDRLVETLIVRGRYWSRYKAEDGNPVVDGSAYNQWVWWDSLGYGNLPYELVITNQLVVSAEVYGMAVHSSLRGGITAGTTSYSKDSRYNTYVYASIFQIMENAPMLVKLRDGEQYSEQQIIEYTAALITHELGHMFFHYAHPFNINACVMNPTPLLKYRQWYEGFDVEACKAGNYPMMQPGAAQIDFNQGW